MACSLLHHPVTERRSDRLGADMIRHLFQLTSSLVRRINSLIAQAEVDHPGMQETAAMVYVGDVYALRELRSRRPADGWGQLPYSCETRNCRRLP